MVNDERIGNHKIKCTMHTFASSPTALTHTITNDFTTTKGNLITIDGKILLDLNNQLGICQTHTITCGRTVEVCISLARKL
jgi:hypothetical protein